MLVLSRRTDESVVVGDAGGGDRMLTVKVLEIKGGRVRLGFEADANVPVHRSEVWERIRVNGRPGALTEGSAVPFA
jgi:carbon storage regulator